MQLKQKILMLVCGFTAFAQPAIGTDYSLLLTEQSHPKTANVSSILQDDTLQGLNVLHSVDEDLIAPLKGFEATQTQELARVFYEALIAGRSITFVGSGSSGRAGSVLSKHFDRAIQKLGIDPSFRGKVLGKIAGGAIAKIKAQENFEDNELSGKALVESLGLSKGDILVAVSASSSATLNKGACKAARAMDETVYYFFNIDSDPFNPRVKTPMAELIKEHGVIPLQFWSGPQAVRGSTRLQASSLFFWSFASVLEEVLYRLSPATPRQTKQSFSELLEASHKALQMQLPCIAERVDRIAKDFLAPDSQYYLPNNPIGFLTYVTDEKLFPTALMETAELPPTYSERPYVNVLDPQEAQDAGIRAYVVGSSNKDAWRQTVLGASEEELEKANNFIICCDVPSGKGNFQDRPKTGRNHTIILTERPLTDSENLMKIVKDHKLSPEVWIFDQPDPTLMGIVRLHEVKTSLNLFSNALMVRGHKVLGNLMIGMVPSNIKLVARAISLIQQITKDYTQKSLPDDEVRAFVTDMYAYRQRNPHMRLPFIVSTGVVSFGLGVDRNEAITILEEAGYNLEKVLKSKFPK
jgi:N-acetylmuramic acid 6-phosphate (MurNAc-6-P) etherase